MVPSIVVHCINEVELRGMNEQGLYRVNGAAADAKCLKDKFLKGKGAPNLSNVDIATICSTLKDFLRYIICVYNKCSTRIYLRKREREKICAFFFL